MIDIETRCPKLPDAVPALTPGSMNKMFEKIISTAPGNRTLTDEERRQLLDDGMPEYTVHVHSRPSEDPVTDISLKTDKTLPPWVITFENFLTDEECDALIQHGHEEGYKRSEDVGKQNFDGTVGSVQSTGRTSENAWCSKRGGCRLKDVPKRIHERMEKVMGIPADNSEDFQILRYEVGQFYRTHHDLYVCIVGAVHVPFCTNQHSTQPFIFFSSSPYVNPLKSTGCSVAFLTNEIGSVDHAF